jgi:hypothetical protein
MKPEVYLETGSANASFEQSKTAKEVGPQDEISKVIHFMPVTSGVSVIQNETTSPQYNLPGFSCSR